MRFKPGSVVVLVLAASSLVPQASAAPALVSSCPFTAVTNVKLTTDLTCTGTSGIVVGANGITIDLNGHSLTGNRTLFAHGINNSSGFDDVTVKGGTVAKFDRGIHANAADRMNVVRVLASGSGDRGFHIVGASARVTSSQASGNAETGMYIEGTSARVTSSKVSGNGIGGMFIDGASARVRSSRASGNGGYGILVQGDAPKIGKTPGRPSSERNQADANGFAGASSDGSGLGIEAIGFTTAPVGRNVSRGNDGAAQCAPSNLCSPVPTPVDVCPFTAVTDIKLSQDLISPGTSCVVIGADGITIDLNGHSITGNRTTPSYGIENLGGFDNVTVMGGTVNKFFNGISASNADGMRVKNVLASGNVSGGIVIFGASARVDSSQASGNTSGITIVGNKGHVTSSLALGNAASGIDINGARARVRSSQAIGNATHGIDTTGDAPKIGQTSGRPASDRNQAHANGFDGGAADGNGLGIFAHNYTTPPAGRNVARGNDSPLGCDPFNLC